METLTTAPISAILHLVFLVIATVYMGGQLICWLISFWKKDVPENSPGNYGKTMGNTSAADAKEKVSDVQFFGNGDKWQLLGKAWSKNEDWMKSSKAYEVPGEGVFLQVTTQQGKNTSESIAWAPGLRVESKRDADGKVIDRDVVADCRDVLRGSLCVVGTSRVSKEIVWNKLDSIHKTRPVNIIVTSTGSGTDEFAISWAEKNKIPVAKILPREMTPDAWREANVLMELISRYVLAFVDDKSVITHHMLEIWNSDEDSKTVVVVDEGDDGITQSA